MPNDKKAPGKKKRGYTRKAKAKPSADVVKTETPVQEAAVEVTSTAPPAAPVVKTVTPVPAPAPTPVPEIVWDDLEISIGLQKFENALFRGTKGVDDRKQMYVAFLAYAHRKSAAWGPSAIAADLEDAYKMLKYIK